MSAAMRLFMAYLMVFAVIVVFAVAAVMAIGGGPTRGRLMFSPVARTGVGDDAPDRRLIGSW